MDIGLTYTKCGFTKDSLPVYIVPTPLTMVHFIRDNLNKVNATTFAKAFENLKKLRLELEEFLNYIFYQYVIIRFLLSFSLLQLNPKERSVVICESLNTPRPLIDSLGHVLFRSFNVRSVYFFMTNSLPLYVTGVDTGIIVDCGF